MPQGIHKPARRSERTSKTSQGPGTASRKTPRTIYPAFLSQSERAAIENWKEGVSETTVRDAREATKYDTIVQAYVAAKLRLFEISLVKEKAEAGQSDTASNTSGRS